MSDLSDLEIGDRPVVFMHRNNPALPSQTCSELTLDGTAVFDWGMGAKWDYTLAKDNHQTAAKKALENILTINRNGGYGVIHTKEYEEVVVGRVSPGCLDFLELTDTNGTDRFFKSVYFDRGEFAAVDVREEYPDLHEVLHNNANFGVNQRLTDNHDVVTDAFIDLDIKDRI